MFKEYLWLLYVVLAGLAWGTYVPIIFYGGSILSQHSFDDNGENLVKAITLCRRFAVYADSDKSAETDDLRPRLNRVISEVTKNEGLMFVSAGREIENYIPEEVLVQIIKSGASGVTKTKHQFEQVLDARKISKVAFAEKAVALFLEDWPLDLKDNVTELVKRIVEAR